MSSVSVASFRWLDALEKEFDTAFVGLDINLNEALSDCENGEFSDESFNDFVFITRDKLTAMSSAWAQLVHKAQTIFEINCKQEAQILGLKSELLEATTFKQSSKKELEKLMIELHSSQLQLQKLKSSQQNQAANNSYTSYASSFLSSSDTADDSVDVIQKRLNDELQKRFGQDNMDHKILMVQKELDDMKKEKGLMNEQIANLTSEVYGARLAAKYLDKELAGRIQQIQLFGKILHNLKSRSL